MHLIKYINFSQIDIMECKSIMYNTFCSPALTVEMEGTILVTATLNLRVKSLFSLKSNQMFTFYRFPSIHVENK